MRRIAALVAAVALLPACGDLLDPAAAVVHGKKIPIEDVQRELDEFVSTGAYKKLAAQGNQGALQREFEQGQLTAMIRRAVLTPAAEEHGIEITQADVDQAIEELITARYQGQRAQLDEEIKEQGLTESQFRELMYDQVLSDSLRIEVTAGVEASAGEVRAFYEDNRSRFETRRAQHILVAERALAEQLAARLQAANERNVEDLFSELAREHSADPASARSGGDLGYHPAGTFPEPFDETVGRLAEGEVSDPVKTESGWHVIRLMDVRVEPFERVRDDIVDYLGGPAQDEAWNEYLRKLYDEADVEVNPRYGVFDEELFVVVDPDAEDIPAGEAPDPGPSPTLPTLPVPAPPPPG